MKDSYYEWLTQPRGVKRNDSKIGRNTWDEEGVNQRYTRELMEDNHFSPNPFDN